MKFFSGTIYLLVLSFLSVTFTLSTSALQETKEPQLIRLPAPFLYDQLQRGKVRYLQVHMLIFNRFAGDVGWIDSQMVEDSLAQEKRNAIAYTLAYLMSLDEDGDGRTSLSDLRKRFETATISGSRRSSYYEKSLGRGRDWQRLVSLDKNQDEFVAFDEALEYAQRVASEYQKRDRVFIDDLFNLDTNGDGRLYKEEFEAIINNAFSQFDIDGNGKILKEEKGILRNSTTNFGNQRTRRVAQQLLPLPADRQAIGKVPQSALEMLVGKRMGNVKEYLAMIASDEDIREEFFEFTANVKAQNSWYSNLASTLGMNFYQYDLNYDSQVSSEEFDHVFDQVTRIESRKSSMRISSEKRLEKLKQGMEAADVNGNNIVTFKEAMDIARLRASELKTRSRERSIKFKSEPLELGGNVYRGAAAFYNMSFSGLFAHFDENGDQYIGLEEAPEEARAIYGNKMKEHSAKLRKVSQSALFSYMMNGSGRRTAAGSPPIPTNRRDFTKNILMQLERWQPTNKPNLTWNAKRASVTKTVETQTAYASLASLILAGDINSDLKLTKLESNSVLRASHNSFFLNIDLDSRRSRMLADQPELFVLIDSDKNNELSINEVLAFSSTIANSRVVQRSSVFEELIQNDPNNDGVITQGEALDILNAFYDQFDKDKSGKLRGGRDGSEMTHFLDAARQYQTDKKQVLLYESLAAKLELILGSKPPRSLVPFELRSDVEAVEYRFAAPTLPDTLRTGVGPRWNDYQTNKMKALKSSKQDREVIIDYFKQISVDKWYLHFYRECTSKYYLMLDVNNDGNLSSEEADSFKELHLEYRKLSGQIIGNADQSRSLFNPQMQEQINSLKPESGNYTETDRYCRKIAFKGSESGKKDRSRNISKIQWDALPADPSSTDYQELRRFEHMFSSLGSYLYEINKRKK